MASDAYNTDLLDEFINYIFREEVSNENELKAWQFIFDLADDALAKYPNSLDVDI